jgi:signal transduction histidine kinase
MSYFFKARARTVEMLGRQQIAGIPTAISEIFKNAHDAYADHVEADYLPAQRLLVIRDDGFGMTPEDFDQRWLTLGTDSKVPGGIGFPAPPRGKARRVMLGEKGIGRLAVAIIGPQALILTRAQRTGVPEDLVVAFVNWAAFDLPGINLNEVSVPVKIFRDGRLPSSDDIRDLVQESLSNLESFAGRTDISRLNEATTDLVEFGIDVAEVVGKLSGLSLSGSGHGTQFFISPTDTGLHVDLEPPASRDEPSQLFQSLIGFSNTMTAGHDRPSLEVVFRNHKRPGFVEDVISSSSFFTLEEIMAADHSFMGEFNAYGQFVGTASIYGKTSEYVIPWTQSHGRPLACGPFKLTLGIIQARRIESRLSPEAYAEITSKLNAIGGLYVYKDDVRVLPYGRQDYDYLDIERNRSKGAAYYYYSYRNIFGAVEITQADNPRLKEKAGREGFQDNVAWRDFRNVLKNFFLQTAADFFRAGGLNSSIFEEQREEYQRLDKAKREREQRARGRRSTFAVSLEAALAKISSGDAHSRVDNILAEFEDKLQSLPTEGRVSALLEAERAARNTLNAVRIAVTISIPRGLSLSPALRREWTAYQAEIRRLDESLFAPATARIAHLLGEAASSSGRDVVVGRWLDNAIADAASETQAAVRAAVRDLNNSYEQLSSRLSAVRDQLMGQTTQAVAAARSRLGSSDTAELDEDELVTLSLDLEDSIRTSANRAQSALQSITAQLQEVVWYQDDRGVVVTEADMTASVEEEVMALREQSELDLELTQLGMAVSVIDHEFQSTIRTIRSGLRRLKAWSDLNPKLGSVYTEIKTSFDHLDGYLTLFTPLQRRLRRTQTEIQCSEIFAFLQNLFGDRLDKDQISFDATNAFRRSVIFGFPSTFYPVFVNLVDNAIFWLSDSRAPRAISLDAEDGDLLVSDNGPGVPLVDRTAIFEPGFTRKPGGRGLGLSISRDALKAASFDLTIETNGKLGGATFRLSRHEDN